MPKKKKSIPESLKSSKRGKALRRGAPRKKKKKKHPPLTPYQKGQIERKIRGMRGGGRDPRGPSLQEELRRAINRKMT